MNALADDDLDYTADDGERGEQPPVDDDLSDDPELLFASEVDVINAIVGGVFRIDCEDHADWLLNKMANIQEEIDRRKAAFEKTQRTLKRKLEWLHKRFGTELEDFALSQLQGGRKKSLRLPCGGVIGYRMRSKPKLVVEDRKAYLTWVVNHAPEHIVDSTPIVDQVAITAEAFANGEIPEGCQMVPPGDAFYVKLT